MIKGFFCGHVDHTEEDDKDEEYGHPGLCLCIKHLRQEMVVALDVAASDADNDEHTYNQELLSMASDIIGNTKLLTDDDLTNVNGVHHVEFANAPMFVDLAGGDGYYA